MRKAIFVNDAYVNLDKVRDDVTVVAIIEDVRSDKAYRSVVLEDRQILYTSLSKGAQQFNKKKWRTDIKITDCGAGNSVPIVKLIQRSHQENILKGYPEIELWELQKFQDTRKSMSDEERKQAGISYRHIRDIMQLRRQSSKDSRRQHNLWEHPVEVLYTDSTPRFCVMVADRVASIIHENDMLVFVFKNSVDAVKLLERVIETDAYVKEVELKRAASQRMRAVHSGNPLQHPTHVYSHQLHAQHLPASALLGGVGLLHSNPQPLPPYSGSLQPAPTSGLAGSARPAAANFSGRPSVAGVPDDIQKLITRRALLQHYSSGGAGSCGAEKSLQQLPLPSASAAPDVKVEMASVLDAELQQQQQEMEVGELEERERFKVSGHGAEGTTSSLPPSSAAAAVTPCPQPYTNGRPVLLSGAKSFGPARFERPQGSAPLPAAAGAPSGTQQRGHARGAKAPTAGLPAHHSHTHSTQHTRRTSPSQSQSSNRSASHPDTCASSLAGTYTGSLHKLAAQPPVQQAGMGSVPAPTPGWQDPPAPDLISPAPPIPAMPGQALAVPGAAPQMAALGVPQGGTKRHMLTRAAEREQQHKELQAAPPTKRRRRAGDTGLGALADAADALALEDQKEAEAEAAAAAEARARVDSDASHGSAAQDALQAPGASVPLDIATQTQGRGQQQQQRPCKEDPLDISGEVTVSDGVQLSQQGPSPGAAAQDGHGKPALPAVPGEGRPQREQGCVPSGDMEGMSRKAVAAASASEADLEAEGVLTASMLERMLATMNQLSTQRLEQAEQSKATLQQEVEDLRRRLEEQKHVHDLQQRAVVQQTEVLQAANCALQVEVARLKEQLAAQQNESQQMAVTMRKFWQQLKGASNGGSAGAAPGTAAAEGGARENGRATAPQANSITD